MSRIVATVAPPRLGVGFRWLLGSSWVSNLGGGISIAAGPLLVASQTRDALRLGRLGLDGPADWEGRPSPCHHRTRRDLPALLAHRFLEVSGAGDDVLVLGEEHQRRDAEDDEPATPAAQVRPCQP